MDVIIPHVCRYCGDQFYSDPDIHTCNPKKACKTFEDAWKEQEALGFQWSQSNINKARFGWELAVAAINSGRRIR